MGSDILAEEMRKLDRMRNEIGLSTSLSCTASDVIRGVATGNLQNEIGSIGNILCRNLMSTAGGAIGAATAIPTTSTITPLDLETWFESRNTGELIGGNPTPASVTLATLGQNLSGTGGAAVYLATAAYDAHHDTWHAEDLTGHHHVHGKPQGSSTRTGRNRT